jgi:hypothetical protein
VARYVGAVLSEGFREFFAATAATAGTLTGLLFVALSVDRGVTRVGTGVIHEVRTAAALLAFTNALAIALYSLVPGTNVGYPSSIFGVIGILFTAAAIRSILTSRSTRRQERQQIGLIRILLLIFGTELVAGIVVLVNPQSSTAAEIIGYALVASLVLGIGRAWELVGNRETGVVASLAILVGRPPAHQGSGDADDPAGQDSGGDAPPRPAPAKDDSPPGG